MPLYIIGVVEIFTNDDVHHAQRESGIAAGIDEEMLVGQFAGAVTMRVNRVEPRALAPRFDDEGPQVDIGAENIRAPGENEPGVAELLGLGAVLEAGGFDETDAASGRTDGTLEPRRAEAMEEAAVHAGALQETHGAAVAIRQDGFGTGRGGDGFETRGDFIERLIPGDAREAALQIGRASWRG